MSFVQHWSRRKPVKTVTVTPGTQMPERGVQQLRGIATSGAIDFEVDDLVFDGDTLEWDDRGSPQIAQVTSVDVFDSRGGSAFMKHISAKYSKRAHGSPHHPTGNSSGGHTIIINGSNVAVAVEGSSITQQLPVTAGFEKLADAVGRAIAIIEETAGVDPDEVQAARESATVVVTEVSKPAPDESVIKRALPTIKGVLTTAATAGAGALASGLIGQLGLSG